jgi:hypothetical protein
LPVLPLIPDRRSQPDNHAEQNTDTHGTGNE